MTLILLQAIIQSIASTLYWIGLYVGIRALPGEKSRRVRWKKAGRGKTDGTVRKPAKRPGSSPGILWVRLPPVLLDWCKSSASASIVPGEHLV